MDIYWHWHIYIYKPSIFHLPSIQNLPSILRYPVDFPPIFFRNASGPFLPLLPKFDACGRGLHLFAGLRLWLQRRAQGAPTGVSGTGRPVFRLVLCSDGGDRGFTAIARWVEDTIMCIYKYSLNIMCVCIYIYIKCMYVYNYIYRFV
jgi:hypothetical protein